MDDRFSRDLWARRKLILRRMAIGSDGFAKQQSIRP